MRFQLLLLCVSLLFALIRSESVTTAKPGEPTYAVFLR